jgi:hypothetical protein
VWRLLRPGALSKDQSGRFLDLSEPQFLQMAAGEPHPPLLNGRFRWAPARPVNSSSYTAPRCAWENVGVHL